MTPNDIKTIHELLANRVVPQSAREGVAIMQLAGRLVSHFANPAPSPQDAATTNKAVKPNEPEPMPDPIPPAPSGP